MDNKAYHRRDADGGSHSTRARGVVLAIMIVSLSGFTVIWLLMAAGMTGSVDQKILLMFRSAADVTDPLGPAWFEEMMAEYSALGGYAILIMAVVIVCAGLVLTGHARLGAFPGRRVCVGQRRLLPAEIPDRAGAAGPCGASRPYLHRQFSKRARDDFHAHLPDPGGPGDQVVFHPCLARSLSSPRR